MLLVGEEDDSTQYLSSNKIKYVEDILFYLSCLSENKGEADYKAILDAFE